MLLLAPRAPYIAPDATMHPFDYSTGFVKIGQKGRPTRGGTRPKIQYEIHEPQMFHIHTDSFKGVRDADPGSSAGSDPTPRPTNVIAPKVSLVPKRRAHLSRSLARAPPPQPGIVGVGSHISRRAASCPPRYRYLNYVGYVRWV